MRLLILSDLHLEFENLILPQVDADILILAGDIGVKTGAVDWIKRQASNYKHVIYIAGNHEYYRADSINVLDNDFKRVFEGTNIHFLQGDSIEIDGILFVGATLWTDYFDGDFSAKAAALAYMTDYELIKVRDPETRDLRLINTRDIETIHKIHKGKLNIALDKPHEKKVVITHHAPSYKSIPSEFENYPTNGCYVNDLEWFAQRANIWVHGHTHNSFDYELGNCRVICNPRGYSPNAVNPKFDTFKVVEI